MKRKFGALILAGLAVAMAQPAMAQDAASALPLDQITLGEEVREAALQAQQYIAQRNFPAATSALNIASGRATSDGERYVIATLQLDIANRTFNNAAQLAAINALLQNPLVTDEERAEFYYHRARIAYHAQDIDAARADLAQAIARNPNDPRIYIAMAAFHDERSDHLNALAMFDRAAAISETAGVRVPAAWYRRAIHFATELDNSARIAQLTVSLVSDYPTRRNWRDALILLRDQYAGNGEAVLDLWRLQDASGALTGEFDYRDYARHARAQESLAEVERLVIAGRAANVIGSGNAEISQLDRGTTAAAQSLRNALPGRAQSAASAATGAAALDAANDYVALGDYAAAIPLYRQALQKGSVDADLANTRLGMVLALTGDAAGARTVLDQVSGSWAPIARLWAVYAQNRPPAPPVAPTPTPATGG